MSVVEVKSIYTLHHSVCPALTWAKTISMAVSADVDVGGNDDVDPAPDLLEDVDDDDDDDAAPVAT